MLATTAAWALLLPLLASLACCPTAAAAAAAEAAAALSCPANVITVDGASTATVISLQPNSSYELGAGVFILNSTVEVLADTVLCVTGKDRVGAPAGVTRLLPPPAAPGSSAQLHFVQYGGLLQLSNLQLEGRAGSAEGGGGVQILKNKDGRGDGQPATFISNLVTFKSNSPRAFANDNDTAASLTFSNSVFSDNVLDKHFCDGGHGVLYCVFTGPPGAAGVTTVSDVTFKGSTVFRNNSWGALYAAAPVNVVFQGTLGVVGNTKDLFNPNDYLGLWGDSAPVYGAGFYASNGARLLFGGRSSFKGNKGAGGCAIALKNASATFMKPTQIVDNEVIKYLDGSGAALNAETSSIVFNGPVTVARNNNTRGAGGACYLKHSNVTFNAAASVQNNSASGSNGYEDGGNSGGGAICAVGSRIVHNNLALYQGNTAVDCSGGALQLQDGSSLVASKLVTFTGNAAMGPSAGSIEAPSYLGGAIYMTRSNVTLTGGASFISNKASPEGEGYGGAICAVGNSTISISGDASFRYNAAWAGGAVKLAMNDSVISLGAAFTASQDQLLLMPGSSSCWLGNSAKQPGTGGAAIHMEKTSQVDFGAPKQHNFGGNRAGKPENDIRVEGGAAFSCNGSRARGPGSYNITGDVCCVTCTGNMCQCPAGQAFAPYYCSCQKQM